MDKLIPKPLLDWHCGALGYYLHFGQALSKRTRIAYHRAGPESFYVAVRLGGWRLMFGRAA